MDIINMIMDFNAPAKFEVGKKYKLENPRSPFCAGSYYKFLVTKRTRCYIWGKKRTSDEEERFKIRIGSSGNEYIETRRFHSNSTYIVL